MPIDDLTLKVSDNFMGEVQHNDTLSVMTGIYHIYDLGYNIHNQRLNIVRFFKNNKINVLNDFALIKRFSFFKMYLGVMYNFLNLDVIIL